MIKAPNKGYTTHMGVLLRTLLISQGDVLELGAGPASTPMLHWACKDMNRRLFTYENTLDYYHYARQFQSALHRIRLVDSWDDIDPDPHYGLVFIDHAPAERRGLDVLRFKNTADYIVIHDTEQKNMYNYEMVWPQFKFIYTWKASRPWTSVVSNSYDLSILEEQTND